MVLSVIFESGFAKSSLERDPESKTRLIELGCFAAKNWGEDAASRNRRRSISWASPMSLREDRGTGRFLLGRITIKKRMRAKFN